MLLLVGAHAGYVGAQTFTQYPMPAGSSLAQLAVGPDGNFWFAERLNPRIGRITRTGVISEFNVSGVTNDVVAGPDGNLWFTEYNANKIGRIDTAGKPAS